MHYAYRVASPGPCTMTCVCHVGTLNPQLSCRVDAIVLMDGDGSEPVVRRGGALKRWMDARDDEALAEDEAHNIQIPPRARSTSEDSRAKGGGSSRTGSERGLVQAAAGSFGTSLAGNAGDNGGTSNRGASGLTTPLLGSFNQVDPVGTAGAMMWNAGKAVGDAVGAVGGGVRSVAKVAEGGVIGGVAGVWGGAKAVAKGAGKVVKAGGKLVGGGKTSPRASGDLGRGGSNSPPPFRDMGRERCVCRARGGIAFENDIYGPRVARSRRPCPVHCPLSRVSGVRERRAKHAHSAPLHSPRRNLVGRA